jgi:pimeloyl-ACP methyl ester carboxylesterase
MMMGVSESQVATRFCRTTINGVDLFYREAGDPSKPTIVLLHGFPTYRQCVAKQHGHRLSIQDRRSA